MFAAARTVVAFGLLLQLAGFAKLLVIADYFGVGPVLDAYYLGLVIPTFITGVSGGIWQAGFVPAYVNARVRADHGFAQRLAGSALTWTVAALGIIALLLIALSGAITHLLAYNASEETRDALRLAFDLLVWMTPLNGIADGGAFLLNAEGRFGVAASAPLLNAAVGTVVLVVGRGRGIDALAWSLLAGLVAQALAVLVALRRAGVSLRPQFAIPVALPRLLTSFALPVLLSVVLGNFVPPFIQAVSSRAGGGAISAMGYAWRLNNAVVQAIVISISAVLLPYFSRLIAEGKNAQLRTALERVFAAALLFSVAAVVLVAVAGPAAVQLLLERGNFNAADTHLVAQVWLALTAGLLGTTWSIFLTRLFQAQQNMLLIVVLGCFSVVVNVTFAYAFLPIWGVVGVALANSLAYTLVMWIFHRRSDRAIGRLLGAATLRFVGRTIVANLLAYAVAVWCRGVLHGSGALAVITCQLAIVAAANVLVARTPPLSISVAALVRQ